MVDAHQEMTDYIIRIFDSKQSRLRKQMLENIALLPSANQAKVIKAMTRAATFDELFSALTIINKLSGTERRGIAEDMLSYTNSNWEFDTDKRLPYAIFAAIITIQDTKAFEDSFKSLLETLGKKCETDAQKAAVPALNELLTILSPEHRLKLAKTVLEGGNNEGQKRLLVVSEATIKSICDYLKKQKVGSIPNGQIAAYFELNNRKIQDILDAHVLKLELGQKADVLSKILLSSSVSLDPRKRLEYASACLQIQDGGLSNYPVFQQLLKSIEGISRGSGSASESDINRLDNCVRNMPQSRQIELAKATLVTNDTRFVNWSDNVMEGIFRTEKQRSLSAPSKESALLSSGGEPAGASSFIIAYPGSGSKSAPQVGVTAENITIFFDKYAGITPDEKLLVDKTLDQFFIMGKQKDARFLIETALNASDHPSSGPFICKMMQCIGSGDRFKLTSDQVVLAARALVGNPQLEEVFGKALAKLAENKQIDDFFALESAISKNGGSTKPEHCILSDLMNKNPKLSGLRITSEFSTPNQSNWVQKLKQKLSFSKA